ncbi:MAG TPA: DegV family protein [Bacillota bacterium]|nr:DegV family protein [Bacillota bacterium]HOK69065.1 DegV family protein [Bacillota bacterium]HPP85842.1 DegV family protein [Bacillota bacterium]
MIAIVTDSTACLTRKEAGAYGVRIVPHTYIVEGRAYKETYADTFAEINPILNTKNTVMSTRQPEVEDFYSAFSQLLAKGYDILCVTLSSRLSSAYYNAVLARRQLNSGRIEVIDSGLAAGGVYLLIKRARHLASAGMSLQEVAGGVYKYMSSISVRFVTDDLSGLRGSHRLVNVSRSVDAFLSKKTLFYMSEGAIAAQPTAAGSARIKRMFAGIPHNASNVIIHYVQPSQRIELVYRLARKLFPQAQVERRQLGPVLGLYLGSSFIGVIWSI